MRQWAEELSAQFAATDARLQLGLVGNTPLQRWRNFADAMRDIEALGLALPPDFDQPWTRAEHFVLL